MKYITDEEYTLLLKAQNRREAQRRATKKYASTHKKEIAGRHRAWVEKNRERLNEYQRLYRAKNKGEIK